MCSIQSRFRNSIAYYCFRFGVSGLRLECGGLEVQGLGLGVGATDGYLKQVPNGSVS